ncbi:anti-sigma F factor antagonist [Dethiothermospora halolimnae]|uniref:anti-sigma F factor antagonist n=1 Tax=Dethiothermospora halolimnae TaxID=3114390 RepID=UPI003CCBFA31
MKLNFRISDEILVVSFNGELDHHTAKDAREEIDDVYNMKRLKHIVLDLKGLNFMDSSGIGLIMGRYKNVNINGGKVVLINVSDRVKKILKMSGILKIVQVYKDEFEALDNL